MTTLIVLGMHRSGTSMLTRAFCEMGASLGPADQLEQHDENVPLSRWNDRLLTELGGGWFGPPAAMRKRWWDGDEIRALRRGAAETARSVLGAPLNVWKDPRLCLTLPFWLDGVLPGEAILVLIVRDPREIADSLARRNGFDAAHSFALWERYLSDALHHAAGRRVVTVSYEELVDAPVPTLHEVAGCLRAWDVRLRDGADGATTVRPEARHHRHEGPLPAGAVTASQAELWTQLGGLPRRSDVFVPPPVAAADPRSTSILDGYARVTRAESRLWSLQHSRRRLLQALWELRPTFGAHGARA